MSTWVQVLAWCRQATSQCLNTLRPRQNGRHFADDMFKCIFLNENVWIPIEISLKFVPKGSINNNPALFEIMIRRRPGDKPLSEPMMVSSLTHTCVTRPHRYPSYRANPETQASRVVQEPGVPQGEVVALRVWRGLLAHLDGAGFLENGEQLDLPERTPWRLPDSSCHKDSSGRTPIMLRWENV